VTVPILSGVSEKTVLFHILGTSATSIGPEFGLGLLRQATCVAPLEEVLESRVGDDGAILLLLLPKVHQHHPARLQPLLYLAEHNKLLVLWSLLLISSL
jgi:hypothetical protein